MAGTMIDIVMKDLAFLEEAFDDSRMNEEQKVFTVRRDLPEKRSKWHRLMGFLQLGE